MLFEGLGVKKDVSKRILKLTRFSDRFFKDFGSFWDLPGDPKIDKKGPKRSKNGGLLPERVPVRSREAFWERFWCFSMLFSMIFDGCWLIFCNVFECLFWSFPIGFQWSEHV